MTVATSAPSPVQRIGYPLVARRLTVQRVETLSPTMRRVVLGGAELEGFRSVGPADHVKLVVPAHPGADVVVPVIEDGRWVNRDEPGLTYRDYTVRSFVPGSGELVIDMVVGDHGPAGRFAASAAPGDVVATLGPRGSALPPMDRERYVLAVDETGLPALANWLDKLPAAARVRALVEVGHPGEEVDLPSAADVEVTWLHRLGAPAGTTALLPTAVAGVLADGWADGASQWWWAAGETGAVRAIRTMLGEHGVGRDSFAMTGYWRRGVENFDHHSPEA